MRTIQVKGTGKIKQKPDYIEITVNLSSADADYNAAFTASEKSLETLIQDLTAAGFKRDDLKTRNFSVDKQYESVNNNGRFEQVFTGYRCTHGLVLYFDYENGRLSKTLDCLSKTKAKCEFNIVFTIKDKDSAKNTMLEKAVADAAAKAKTLTTASNVKLGDIQNIVYDWTDIRFASPTHYQPRVYNALTSAKAASADIVPEDVQASDTVTVVWEIK